MSPAEREVLGMLQRGEHGRANDIELEWIKDSHMQPYSDPSRPVRTEVEGAEPVMVYRASSPPWGLRVVWVLDGYIDGGVVSNIDGLILNEEAGQTRWPMT